jgi:hypothetical protein
MLVVVQTIVSNISDAGLYRKDEIHSNERWPIRMVCPELKFHFWKEGP